MDGNELRLREQEIEEIENKINGLEEEKNENEVKEEKYIKIQDNIVKAAIVFTALNMILLAISNNSNIINLDINSIANFSFSGFYLFLGSSVLNGFYIHNLRKVIKKLNVELNENNELLLTRTNTLNELKNKNNKIENEYTNYKYRVINNSDCLIETKGKTRIRKRDK